MSKQATTRKPDSIKEEQFLEDEVDSIATIEVQETEKEEKLEVEPEANFRLVAKAERLKAILKAINVVNDEVTFQIAKAGVAIRQMDASHVYMVDGSLPAQSFIEFECMTEGRITVNVATLRKILHRASDEDNVHLSIEGVKLVVSSPDRTFRLSTYENTDLQPIPKVDLKTHGKVKSDAFVNSLKDLEITETEYCELAVKDKDIRVRAKGDAVQADIAMSKGTLDTFVSDEVSSGYSLNILLPIAEANKSVADELSIAFDKDMPINMSWKPYKNGYLNFYLAPRIEG